MQGETLMKRRAPAMDRETLAAEIASLSKLDIDELRKRWKAIYGRAPSGEIGRSFLTRAISYRFNTTPSMGRLTLNVLLSFAQFEREVTGERIRDKIAASK